MRKVLLIAPMSSVHERFNKSNIAILKQLGFQVCLAANFNSSSHDIEYQQEVEKEGIKTYQIPFVRSSLIKNLLAISQLRALLHREKFDMVHCHTETGGVITRLCMNANLSIPYIYTPHGMSFFKGSSLLSQTIYRPIEKWICKKMTCVLAMNEEELSTLKHWNPMSARFVHGIGIDLKSIRDYKADSKTLRLELNIPLDAQIILSVGELSKNKNHQVIIQTLVDLENVYYVICGEGPQRKALLSQARSLKVEKRLILAGYRNDVLSFYHLADIFVFPSHHEGLSVSLMEAMAIGVPVVCSRIRGNVDLVKDEEGGFLCDVNNYRAFTVAIHRLLNDERLRKDFKQINQQRIQAFSKANVENELFQLYSSPIFPK